MSMAPVSAPSAGKTTGVARGLNLYARASSQGETVSYRPRDIVQVLHANRRGLQRVT